MKKKKVDDPVIESSESDDGESEDAVSSSDDEDKYLTVQEKKLKVAKKVLAEIESAEREKLSNENNLDDAVLKKLKECELDKLGKLKKKVADSVQFDINNAASLHCKQHSLSITCLVVSRDNRHLFSSSKDWTIVRWSLTDFSKLNFIAFKHKKKKNGVADSKSDSYHNSTINCLEVSRDDKYLISGDDKGLINVWLSESLTHVHKFQAHKNSVTDLVVCRETNTMYSTSKDALVKVWSLDELGYMETLFGHQSTITSVDILNSNRIVTSGGTDKTVRVWKIQEESNLTYNGHNSSIDIVKKLDEEFFVSGGDDGALCLWTVLRKKPLCVVVKAHGVNPENEEPNWITSLAVYPSSDLVASGSCDGFIRLWKWSQNTKSIASLSTIPVTGFVNKIQFTSDGHYLVAGVAKEHRLGRWQNFKEAKNQILCIPISYDE